MPVQTPWLVHNTTVMEMVRIHLGWFQLFFVAASIH